MSCNWPILEYWLNGTGNQYSQQAPQPDFAAEYQSRHEQLLQGKVMIFMGVAVELSLKPKTGVHTYVYTYLSGLPRVPR